MLFFALLTMLAIAAIAVPIVYNLSLQLDPEDVRVARQRWQEHGPSDYVLEYLVKHDRDPRGDEYWVKVRNGQVVSVFRNGAPLLLDNAAGLFLGFGSRTLPEGDYSAYGVDGLFDEIERLVHEGIGGEGKRDYATATFDKVDGHPVRFIFRVARSDTRLEWQVKLRRLELASPAS
jgi:hypothetical protein